LPFSLFSRCGGWEGAGEEGRGDEGSWAEEGWEGDEGSDQIATATRDKLPP
jgi:hypothetical protein